MAELVGYARISTGEQDAALQLDALKARGCTRIYTDTASGALERRPQLAASSTSKALPACETSPVASATTCSLGLRVRRVTFGDPPGPGGARTSTHPILV